MLKNKLASDMFIYTAATYLVQFLGIFTSFAMRYYLEPTLMGFWSLLDLMLRYGLMANLGMLNAFYTELPVCTGKGDHEKALSISRVTFTFVFLISLLVGAAFIVWAVFFGQAHTDSFRIGAGLMGLLLPLTGIYNYYLMLMMAEKRFGLLSRTILINAALYLGLILLWAPQWKLLGLLGAAIVSTLASTVWVYWVVRKPDRWLWDTKRLVELLKLGIPLVIVGFAFTFFESADRVIIAKWLGVTALGHYSIAIFVTTYANTVPRLLAIVIFPNLQEHYGLTGSKTEISKFITKPVELLCCSVPLLLALGYFAVPPLVHAFLPKYAPGMDSMRILLIGSFFFSLGQPIQNYLTTIHKRLHNIPLILLGVAAIYGTSWFLLQRGHGLEGVAIGMCTGFFVYYTAVFFFVFGHFSTPRECALFYAKTLVYFAYFAGATWWVDSAVHLSTAWVSCLTQFLLYAVLWLPALIWADKQTGYLSILRSMKRQTA